MVKLSRYFLETSAGPRLTINEDCAGIDIINNLFIIVDGFGGVTRGPACSTELVDSIKNFYTKISGDPDSTLPFFYSHKYLIEGNAIVNALNYAHAIICKDNFNKALDVMGGASVLAAAMSENIMTFVSAGNCASFLCRRGNIEEITKPDILLNIATDAITYEQGTIPMSGLGLFEDLHTHVVERRILAGDLVILMSDGIYSKVKLNEVLHTIENKEIHFDKKAKLLMDLSNQRGNLDNQTLVLLQF